MSATAPVNRWRIFAATWFINLFVSATAIFSVFSLPMTKLRGWSMTDFTLAYSIYMFTYCAIGIFSGRLSDTLGPRLVLYAGGLLFGLGWFCTGLFDSIPGLYLAYGIFAGVGGGAVYNASVTTTLKWFPDKGGSITGFLMTANVLGPVVCAPLANWLLQQYGPLATCRILGVVFIIGVFLVAWILQRPPEKYQPAGWIPAAAQNAGAAPAGSVNYSWQQMLKSPIFYLLFVMFALANVSGTLLVGNNSVIAQEQVKLTAAVAATCVSAFMIANFVGRISFGIIFDKIGGIRTLMLCLVMNIVGMLLLTRATSLGVYLFCLALVGVSFGGQLVAFAPLVKELFGAKFFGQNYGIMFLAYGVGSVIGPRIASHFRDAAGQFIAAFVWAAVIAAVALAMMFFIGRIYRQRGQTAENF